MQRPKANSYVLHGTTTERVRFPDSASTGGKALHHLYRIHARRGCPRHQDLLKWAQERARTHYQLVENTDYAFTALFYQALQFPLFSKYFSDEALSGLDKGRAARNLSKFSSL